MGPILTRGKKAAIPTNASGKLLEVTVVAITTLNMSTAVAFAAINTNVCNATCCVVCEV